MLQLGAAEGLSAVSLTRRFAPEAYFGDPEALLGLDWDKPKDRAALRFPSTRSIAAAPLRALALARAPGALLAWEGAVDRLTAAIGFEAPGNLIPALGAMDEAGCRQDGDWLYPERYAVAVIEKEYPTVAGDRALGALANRAYDELRALHKALGTSPDSQPTPYYAVLMMDVDSLGKALSGRHDAVFGRAGKSPRPLLPSRQAAISERLANLSVFVLPKVVHAHLGRVVYCGGDDLLALLPLHTALRCADALRAAVQSLDGLGPLLTVSVGVGIGHSITPMREVIQAARDAEKRAKQPLGAKVEVHGDHLGVEVRLRSGRPFGLTLPWRPRATDGAVSLVQALVDARFGDSEGAPRLNALPKFEAELAAMLGPALDVGAPLWQQPASPQVLHRLGVHLGYLEQGGAHSAIFKQLLAMAPGGARATPAHLVALLRLARFLRRELPTDDLKPLLDVVLPAGSRQ
jgi:hypothetical protein